MSSNTPPNNSPLEQMAAFMISRARDVGVTEKQVLQLLGFKGGIGPIETLLSGRPPTETIPEIAHGIKEGTDEVLKATRAEVERAIPMVILDEHIHHYHLATAPPADAALPLPHFRVPLSQVRAAM